MNLFDFEFVAENLETSDLYGSDSSVANMYLLQKKYNTQFKIKKNVLLRYYTGEENRTGYAFPLFLKNTDATQNFDEKLKHALELIFEDAAEEKREPRFCLITQEQKNQIDSCLECYFSNHRVSWKTNRDDCDYIYLQKNLSELTGSTYQKKRNHISRFNRIYGSCWDFKYYPQNNIKDDILTVSETWFKEKDGENNHDLCLELESIKLALEKQALFNLRGGVLYIHGKPAAMTLASPISDTVLDVIYEKSIFEYEKDGSYAVINQQFARHSDSFLYLNREEDMGIEGLRKAKLSYKPTMILEKFYGRVE